MPPAQGVPLETHAHLAQAMQPCDPLQQHLPSHARQCAGGSVLHPSLHGLPVMPSQSGAIPLQAPFMPPHGRGFLDQPVLPLHSGAIPPQMQAMLPHGGAVLHQTVLPSQSGGIPPQMQAMLPQPPVTPLHLGMVGQKPSPCQSAAPTHMALPLRPPRSPPSYYPAHAAPTVLMPPRDSGARPPYEYAR